MSASDEQFVVIPGPAGGLEAIWSPSVVNVHEAAVICHPHPLHGGTMGNKVVTTLARVWRDAGMATLRFNFRGVGASAGLHADGVGEIDDLLAVLQWLHKEQDVNTVSLGGFSFGAWVAAAAAARLPAGLSLRQLVLVAPPVQYPGFAGLEVPAATIVLQGDADDVVDPAMVGDWADSRRLSPEVVRFAGVGHFFHGRLSQLKAELAARLNP
ncbi:MAG: hypothetical protein K0S46_260 [Moraxellaceae bacterium]|jgi:alpha/beta superfamily hydrolase|nr:hypothetical protein [Moraxellaceae bacterium]